MALLSHGGLTAKGREAGRTPVGRHDPISKHVEAVRDAVLSACATEGKGAPTEGDGVDVRSRARADATVI